MSPDSALILATTVIHETVVRYAGANVALPIVLSVIAIALATACLIHQVIVRGGSRLRSHPSHTKERS